MHAFQQFKVQIPSVGEAEGVGSVWADSVGFFSLPFGRSPDGDRVLKPPEAYPTPWPHTFGGQPEAVPVCKSFPEPGTVTGVRDCLYLNLHIPLDTAQRIHEGRAPVRLLPVMIWIHGGGFKDGNSHGGGLHDAGSLVATQDVIVATVNYRLGPEGFLAHPSMLRSGSSYNLGLLDQRLAMRWVHEHIEAFGGDAAKTVIFGGSSGAMSVCFHLTSPQSYPYFRGAALQSGSCEGPAIWMEKRRAETFGRVVADTIGCGLDEEAEFECLQSNLDRWQGLSWEEWMDVGSPLGVAPDTRLEPLAPVVDLSTEGLMDQPGLLVEAGLFNKVPLIVGTNRDEGALFRMFTPVPGRNRQSFADFIFHIVGPEYLEDIYDLYGPVNNNFAFNRALGDLFGDLLFQCPSYRLARAASRHSVDVFAYRFTQAVTISTAIGQAWQVLYDRVVTGELDMEAAIGLYLTYQGVPHSMDLFFLFDADQNAARSVKVINFGPSERRLIGSFQALWGKFGRDLDPNGALGLASGGFPREELPAWPRYDPDDHDGTVLRIKDPPSVEAGSRDIEAEVQRRCAWWDAHPELMSNRDRPWMTATDRRDLGKRCCCLDRDASICKRLESGVSSMLGRCTSMDVGNGPEGTSHAENGCVPSGYEIQQCCCVSANDVGFGATEPVCQTLSDPDLGRRSRCPHMCRDRESPVGYSPCEPTWHHRYTRAGITSYEDKSRCGS